MSAKIKALFMDLYKLRHYVVLSAILFIAGVYLGYKSTIFHNYLEGQIEGLADVAGRLLELENSQFWFFMFIFLNNTIKSILVIYIGLFFGILPILFLLINGMILGYLYYYVVILHESGTLGQLVVGILPHGIIELPIIIIACAFGIRMGVLVFKKIGGLFIPEHRRKKGEMMDFMIRTPVFMLFITVSLLAAALIETFITPLFMNL